MLNQKLSLKLQQKLSPQQIQLMKLLQIPTVALEQRIKQEIEENPALEDGADPEEVENNNQDETAEDAPDGESNAEDEFDVTDYVDDDEEPSYKYSANNSSPDDEIKQVPFVSGTSFHDFLEKQLGMYVLDDHRNDIALFIIGNLDDSGYLSRDLDAMVDDLAFSMNIQTDKQELLRLLKIIQEFDPPGVGARNLQECLLIQLQKKDDTDEGVQKATIIIRDHFNEFTKKHYEKIQKKTGFTADDLKIAIEEVLRLNPKPGNSMSDTIRTNHYIIPDFIVNNQNGELELMLNSRNTPELRVNRTYQDMLRDYAKAKKKNGQQKEAIQFVKQKIESAKWFIDAIKQRQNTLFRTMEAIMNYQYEYFLEGDETLLKPMILKDIAEVVNLDISTISRVASSKYVQTPYGTFLLKSFFSESMQTEAGEEVSTREVKKILEECVENENKKKPLTDEQLMNILKEKGYTIARRTVAKYREQLNIPVARLRKEL